MVGRIYVVKHYVLLHTKYRSCSFMVSIFLKLFPSKSMEAIAKHPEGLANLDPGAWLA